MNTTDKIMALADDVIDHAWNDGMRRKDKFMGERTLAARQALRAEIETLVRDAERYRWLRRGGYPIQFAQSVLNDTPFGIDAAIDAAMQEKKS